MTKPSMDYKSSIVQGTLDFSKKQYENILNKIRESSDGLKEGLLKYPELRLYFELPDEDFAFSASSPVDIDCVVNSLEEVVNNYRSFRKSSKKELKEMKPKNIFLRGLKKLYNSLFEYSS